MLLRFTVFLCLVFWPQASQADSSLRVENGVYSRVTVQIEEQPQPENCVEYLNHLEVRKLEFSEPFYLVVKSLSSLELASLIEILQQELQIVIKISSKTFHSINS